MSPPATKAAPERLAVAEALRSAAEHFPRLGPSQFDPDHLVPQQRRLAVAIHRTVLQRWLTLEHLLNLHLHRPLRTLEPPMQAVLLSGAAQIVFMDAIPTYAVVDQHAELARYLVASRAAGMANAVLRRLGELIIGTEHDQTWEPAPDRLPAFEGVVHLGHNVLPDTRHLAEHLGLATSHPSILIHNWLDRFGPQQATAIALHGIRRPATIVAVESDCPTGPTWTAHGQSGFVIWSGTHGQLVEFLHGHPARRVQDPASALAVAAVADLPIERIVDYGAGLGTKTRQLAATFPTARIVATDINTTYLKVLGQQFRDNPAVTVTDLDQVATTYGHRGADLVLLDVPCSNTAVLGRRPEARYRFGKIALARLTKLQRTMAELAMRLLRPTGWLLYSTCSLEPQENQHQIKWIVEQFGATVLQQHQQLPGGEDGNSHDGSFFALIQLP